MASEELKSKVYTLVENGKKNMTKEEVRMLWRYLIKPSISTDKMEMRMVR